MNVKNTYLRTWIGFSLIMLLFISCLLTGVSAYTSAVESDLKSTRDALLKQKSDIEEMIDKKNNQVANLQSDIDRLRAYLRDTDHALTSVDAALRGR